MAKPTPQQAAAAKVREIRRRKFASGAATTFGILGRSPDKEPGLYREKPIIQTTRPITRKQRRSAYEIPGQNAAEMRLGLSDSGNLN